MAYQIRFPALYQRPPKGRLSQAQSGWVDNPPFAGEANIYADQQQMPSVFSMLGAAENPLLTMGQAAGASLVSDPLYDQLLQGANQAERATKKRKEIYDLTQGEFSDPPLPKPVILGGQPGQAQAGAAGQAAMNAPSQYGIRSGEDAGFGTGPETSQMTRPDGSMDQAAAMGLIAAGLGILGNNYGYYGKPMPAIGKGGMMGLQTYIGEKERASQNALRQQQAQSYQAQVQAQLAGQERANKMQAKIDALVEQLSTESDPQKIRALTKQIAILQGDAAKVFSDEYRSKFQRAYKGTEGAGDGMKRDVLIDPESNEIVWRGEPYKVGAGQTVNVLPGEKAFEQKYMGKQGETASDIEMMGEKAYSTMDQTNKMIDIARRWRQAGGQLGKFADVQSFASSVMQGLNLSPSALGLPADAGPAQALDAISNTFVLSKIGGEGGMPANNFSNADREFLQATKPQKTNTPEGFLLIAMIERGAARRAMQRDEMLQDELDQFPESQSQQAYQSFRRKWRAYVKATSAWTEEEKREMNQIRAMLADPNQKPGQPSSDDRNPWER